MHFIEKHYQVLREIGPVEQSWVGNKLQSYAKTVCQRTGDCQLAELPDESVGRDYLFRMAENPAINTFTCCTAVFAWGGMRRDHARAVLANAGKWLHIADAIREQGLSRYDAYSLFIRARHEKILPGMGPAFFTKLIYFLGERAPSRGYIMDQWTALSANLLLGRNMIDLQKIGTSFRVSDSNSPATYDSFCDFIEQLASNLNESPDSAEMRIFSSGGSGSRTGKWRAHVKRCTQPEIA